MERTVNFNFDFNSRMARALRDRPLYRFILENPSATQQQRDEYMRDAYRQYHSMRRMSHAPVQDSDNNVDALFPVTRASDSSETDIEEQVREFRRQFGDAERVHRQRRRQRFRADNFERELEWNLETLFWEEQATVSLASSSYYSSSDDSEELEGAVGYDTGARPENDWGELQPNRSEFRERSILGQCLVDAQFEVQRLLLLAIIQIKVENRNFNSEDAWQALCSWLISESVTEQREDADSVWWYAFRGREFGQVFDSSLHEIRLMWREAHGRRD